MNGRVWCTSISVTTLTEETKVLGVKCFNIQLCPPQISHQLTWVSNPILRSEMPATNPLSYGTAW